MRRKPRESRLRAALRRYAPQSGAAARAERAVYGPRSPRATLDAARHRAGQRIWDLLDNYKEVVEGLESTNESVISHRHNEVLRVLTVFTVLLLPLTLIASLFGMNVVFPGEGTDEAFWVILGLMVGAIGGLAAFFRWKRWL